MTMPRFTGEGREGRRGELVQERGGGGDLRQKRFSPVLSTRKPSTGEAPAEMR